MSFRPTFFLIITVIALMFGAASPAHGALNTNVWLKINNVVPDVSDATSTDGRIPLGDSGDDDSHVLYLGMIKDLDTYKMWYAGYDGANYRIYYATSSDGLTWTKYNNDAPDNSNDTGTDGRIPRGTTGGDTTHVYNPAIIKDGSTYKMWYSGSDGTNTRIYYATSTDGLTWTKYNNNVPGSSDSTGTDGRIPLGTSGGDTKHAIFPTVIKDGSTYKMWYAGHDATNYRIYYATSTNGLTWTKLNNVVEANSDTTGTDGRIPLGDSGGDTTHARNPCVIKDGSTYKMWYTGYDGSNYRIYYATSTNGLTWTKFDNAVPADSDNTSSNGCVPLGSTAGRGDVNHVLSCSVIKEGLYKIWYAGSDGANWRIYYATQEGPGPIVSNNPAANVTATNAWLIGDLISTGEAPAVVYVYWGQTNGYTTKGDWATNDYLGTNDVGLLTNKIYSLNAGTRYYYRFYATNSAGDDWADSSELFSTLGAPGVDNDGGATDLVPPTATLRGEVTGGNPTPTAYIYWGLTDEGTTKAAWDNEVVVGLASNWTFSTVASGLLANQTNFYRCYASNSYGDVWASSSTNFMGVPTLSINDAPGVGEGASGTTSAVFTVTLSATSVVDVTVGFATSNGTAEAGTDYIATNGTLTIAAGVKSNTITVEVIGDVEDEFPSENFYVDLSNATNATISDSRGEGTIGDDDGVTSRLVIQQGVVPTINGVPISGADSYTGTVDTYVDRSNPTISYGDATILCFGRHHKDSPDETTHAWMRFENFTNYLPANAAIILAKLYLTSAGDGPYVNASTLRFMTAAWTTNMTWNSHTSSGVDIGSIRMNYYGYGSEIWALNEVEWLDMTAMMQAWHSGERANNGLMFKSYMGGSLIGYIERRCFSSEYGTASKRPRLEIDYVTGESIVGSGSWFEGLVVITNGPSVFEDTYIKSNAVNYASDTYAPYLQTWNRALMPERILIRIKMDNPLLSKLARTGEMAADKLILVAAQLQFNDRVINREYSLDIWKLSQDWIVDQATGLTRDGTTPWDQVWVKAINNIDGARVDRSSSDDIFQAGTRIFDITTVLQGYVDGTNNYGFVVGNATGTYEMSVYLTEIGYDFLRPTLVLQLKTCPRGTMIKIR